MICASRAARPGLLFLDATREPATWTLWGMTLAERLLRQASLCGIRRVVLCLSDTTRCLPAAWRADLQRIHPHECRLVDAGADLRGLVDDPVAGILIADGDVLHDERLLAHLLRTGPDHAIVGDHCAIAWLSPAQWSARAGRWRTTAGCAAIVEGMPHTRVEDLGQYVPELRLTMPAFMIRLRHRHDLRRADHLLYRRTFKGVIDGIARYGYYHLVRFVTRGLSRTTLRPNFFTALSILGIWAAIPLFAGGYWIAGCASAWLGVLLDSIDGKLARLTLQLSSTMGSVEHLTAMPGLALWFVAVGWQLSQGQLLSCSPPAVACWITLLTFLADKVLSGFFRRHFGRELFDARPLDAFFHLFAVRRNMHLLILTIGVAADAVEEAFLAMAGGMVLTFLFHLLRSAWICLTGGVGDDEPDPEPLP